MRFSHVLRADMPGPKVYLSWWGASDISKQKGIYQYTLSPYQAKAAPHMIRNYLFNGARRLSVYALPIIVPVSIYYYVWQAAVKEYHWLNSKEGHLASAGHAHEE